MKTLEQIAGGKFPPTLPNPALNWVTDTNVISREKCATAIREWAEQAKPFLQHHRLLLQQLRGHEKEIAELDELLKGL